LNRISGLDAVFGFNHLKLVSLQDRPQVSSNGRFIVDNKAGFLRHDMTRMPYIK